MTGKFPKVMLITGGSIRETLAFPLAKPKNAGGPGER